MKLFDVDNNNNVTVKPEALLIQGFKVLWDRDKTKNKTVAIKELAYIYFISDFKSSYQSYSVEERHAQVCFDLGVAINKDEEAIINAIAVYKRTQNTFSMTFLESAKRAARELINFFNTVDLNERTERGNPVYKPSDITNALSSSVKVIEALDKWTEKVQQELELTDEKIRGGGQIGYFENP